MPIECEGIVLRQTKILKGRRMIVLLTEKNGKLSCGTNISERSKSKSALAIRPFTLGSYNISLVKKDKKNYYNIKSAEVVKPYYSFGDDYERFTGASLALEFTDRLLIEEAEVPEIYRLLNTYMDLMAIRKKAYKTLTVSYFIKLLQNAGVFPEPENFTADSLLSALDSDIIKKLVFIMENPLIRMETLAMDEISENRLQRLVLQYAEKHLDISSLKSDI